MQAHVCHIVHVEVRGRLLGASSLLPFWELGVELRLSGLHSKPAPLLCRITGPLMSILKQHLHLSNFRLSDTNSIFNTCVINISDVPWQIDLKAEQGHLALSIFLCGCR